MTKISQIVIILSTPANILNDTIYCELYLINYNSENTAISGVRIHVHERKDSLDLCSEAMISEDIRYRGMNHCVQDIPGGYNDRSLGRELID